MVQSAGQQGRFYSIILPIPHAHRPNNSASTSPQGSSTPKTCRLAPQKVQVLLRRMRFPKTSKPAKTKRTAWGDTGGNQANDTVHGEALKGNIDGGMGSCGLWPIDRFAVKMPTTVGKHPTPLLYLNFLTERYHCYVPGDLRQPRGGSFILPAL